MKVILYVNSFLPSVGGREVVVHYLARTLTELGHQVRVVGAPGWWRNRKVKMSYPVHRYPSSRGLFPRQVAFLQLLFDVLLFGGDVINAHATFPAGYVASKLKKLLNIPLVVTPHGEDILVVPEIGFGARLSPEVNKKIEYTLANADVITAISDMIRAAALEVVGDPDKVRMIANGVDNKRFERKVTANLHKWLNVPPESRLFVTVGHYHPRKGHEVIIRAMRSLLKSHPSARLVIVGRGTEALRPLVAELDLTDKVVLTGPISFPLTNSAVSSSPSSSNDTDWLAAIYQNSELYISAGIGEGAEGLSLAVLDAMATGLPVIATNISGNQDVVINDVSGLLVRPGDEEDLANAICRLLSNRDLGQKMGEKAKHIAKRYYWINIAKEYVSVYSGVRNKSALEK